MAPWPAICAVLVFSCAVLFPWREIKIIRGKVFQTTSLMLLSIILLLAVTWSGFLLSRIPVLNTGLDILLIGFIALIFVNSDSLVEIVRKYSARGPLALASQAVGHLINTVGAGVLVLILLLTSVQEWSFVLNSLAVVVIGFSCIYLLAKLTWLKPQTFVFRAALLGLAFLVVDLPLAVFLADAWLLGLLFSFFLPEVLGSWLFDLRKLSSYLALLLLAVGFVADLQIVYFGLGYLLIRRFWFWAMAWVSARSANFSESVYRYLGALLVPAMWSFPLLTLLPLRTELKSLLAGSFLVVIIIENVILRVSLPRILRKCGELSAEQ